jgi:hypothetical protein
MTEQPTLIFTPCTEKGVCCESTLNSRPFSSKSLSFTHFPKNASATPLESHSFKTKDLKPFRFTHLQKKGGWRGAGPGLRAIDARHRNGRPARKRGVPSNLQPHTSNLCSSLTPLDSALTSKRAAKSFTCNTYEKHTQGEGGPPRLGTRITNHESPVTASMRYNLPRHTGAKENHR